MTETASGNSSRLVAQLCAGFADALDEQMEEGEETFAALVCVWTTKGARWHVATAGKAPGKTDVLKLLNELAQAVGESETRTAGRIGVENNA